jgi:hypothetical protein
MTVGEGIPALWLRGLDEFAKSTPSRVVLWPAIEYTVLVYGREQVNDADDLDPFERAVFGASAANVVGIVDQAAHLDLDPQFIAHLHRRLIERGIFDHHSRPRDPDRSLEPEETLFAVRVYQDPWSGGLWPRFVPDNERRTLARSDVDPRRVLMGTTGSPTEVPAFSVPHPSAERSTPTSDDAIRVLNDWVRLRSRHQLPGSKMPTNRSARLLPDTQENVLLCCPSERSGSRRPTVHDPFGGPEWSPLIHGLVTQARNQRPFHNWLFNSENEVDPAPQRNEVVATPVHQRLCDLVEDWDHLSNRPDRRRETLLELESIAHAALDLLTELAPYEPVSFADQTDFEGWLRKAALTFGFTPEGLEPIGKLRPENTITHSSVAARCAALLSMFPAHQHGPLHELAVHQPGLFGLLRLAGTKANRAGLGQFRQVVQALADIATPSPETEQTLETA